MVSSFFAMESDRRGTKRTSEFSLAAEYLGTSQADDGVTLLVANVKEFRDRAEALKQFTVDTLETLAAQSA